MPTEIKKRGLEFRRGHGLAICGQHVPWGDTMESAFDPLEQHEQHCIQCGRTLRDILVMSGIVPGVGHRKQPSLDEFLDVIHDAAPDLYKALTDWAIAQYYQAVASDDERHLSADVDAVALAIILNGQKHYKANRSGNREKG